MDRPFRSGSGDDMDFARDRHGVFTGLTEFIEIEYEGRPRPRLS